MNDYYFRVKASDRAELRRVLRAINVMRGSGNDFTTERSGDAWAEVGPIENWRIPGTWVKDVLSGEVYWHFNLRTGVNVRRRIKNLVADGDPDALILDSARGRWYASVIDDEEQPPTTPKWVWL